MAKTKKPKSKTPEPPRIIYHTNDELYNYFNPSNITVADKVFDAISYGVTHNKKDVVLYEIQYALDKSNTVILTSPREHWSGSLADLVRQYNAVESFEKTKNVIAIAKQLMMPISKSRV